MSALGPKLTAAQPDNGEYRPIIFRLPQDGGALEQLLADRPGIRIADRIGAQLRELAKTLNPGTRFTPESLQEAADKHLAGRPAGEYGCWVYYPWSDRLVHLLDAEEFGLVRTDRNRQKITREEQAVLSRKKVGVIGLSVGQSVSLTMALERTFGEIRLADFDTLDLSNLNRIRTGVRNLGINKAVVTAREIAEIDPFLQVICFTDGLTPGNMDAFFTEGGQLDILVEECDSVEIKIMARQKAKALGIPVVMDMSDRGCLDVERFDLEPARPLMHGWIDHLDLEAASRPMTAEEKVPFMLPITGVDTLSPRMKASVIELGQSIGTWPQLATSVVLGGALAGDAVRRIALGQFHASGRWFVDMEELVSDHAEAAPAAPSAPSEFKPEAAAIAKIFQQLGPASGNAVDPGKAMVAQLVEAGGLAPSAGNMQPWKFLWKDRRLLLFQDTGRSRSWIDPDGLAARLALGAAMENVEVKAQELGFACTAASFPVQDNPTLAAAFTFSAGPAGSTEKHNGLAAMIGKRCTNRKVVRREPLPEGAFTALAEAVATIPGCQLHLTEDPEVLGRLAKLCGQAERIQWMNPDGHRDYFRQLRWTTEAAATSRDGLDLATLELLPMQEAALRVVSDRKAMDLIDGWQAGQGLERSAAFPVMNASAMLLLSTANDDAPAHLDAGRALERMWLRATALQLGIHPMPGPVLLPRLPAHAAQGLRDHERQAVATIGEELRACYHQGKRTPVFLLCLTRSEKPSMRSKRRPVEEILMLS